MKDQSSIEHDRAHRQSFESAEGNEHIQYEQRAVKASGKLLIGSGTRGRHGDARRFPARASEANSGKLLLTLQRLSPRRQPKIRVLSVYLEQSASPGADLLTASMAVGARARGVVRFEHRQIQIVTCRFVRR